MAEQQLRGIIQSRGLGDILIALPIARHYFDQGEKIVWPVCEEFIPAVESYAPWVNWVSVPTDPAGAFFLQTPLRVFEQWGVDPDEALYLYQYLNIVPELTDPEFFNILKFDQYKYQMAGVPFIKKWDLGRCITRSNDRELALKDRLNQSFDLSKPYAVVHLTGSSARVDESIVRAFIDPAVQIINIDLFLDKNSSPFDWIGIIERAKIFVGLDSVYANMVDQLAITAPELYWIRRSAWDLTPVLGQAWQFVPTNLPIAEPKRVDPQAEAAKKLGRTSSQQPAPAPQAPPQPQASQERGNAGLVSHVPFATDKSKIPTSFMHALKK